MTIPKELQYLDKLIRSRVAAETEKGAHVVHINEPKMPPYSQWELPLGQYVQDNKLEPDEARLLLIGLAHNIQPDLFQAAIENTLKNGGEFPKIGGTNGKNFRGFLPTGDTALFLLGEGDWKKRLEIQQLFAADHFFATKKILWLEDVPQGEPTMSGKIILSQEHIEQFMQGKSAPPHFGMSFPAKRITTGLNWDHLVVNDHLRKQIGDLLDWKQYHDKLKENTADQGRFRNGYRTLFYGPPGTGKTFTASLLGKTMNKDVYRIDLSMIVSKYIGETEKNLEMLFARAEDKDWILFFDEADAIFSKRTNTRDAHDKYANQEVSYLLQRIEDYNGLVILASNMKNNIDEAFIRRFNSILHFPMPDADERRMIWEKTFLPGTISPDLIEKLKKYQLSGGSILNIVHYASIKAAKRTEDASPPNSAKSASPPHSAKGASPAHSKGAATGKTIGPGNAVGGTKATKPPFQIDLSDVTHGIQLELSKDNIPFK